MKVLVYTDKGGSGKTTVATEVLPFYFQNFTLVDTDPNNFTSTMKFPNGQVEAFDPRKMLKDLNEKKRFRKVLKSEENLIIDTAGGYLANLVVDILDKEDFLNELDIAIIPILVGGKMEANALKSYLNLKKKGFKGRIIFALIGVDKLDWVSIQQLFPTWFGLEFLVEEELSEFEKVLGKIHLTIEEGKMESSVDEKDRNYLIVPRLNYLFVKEAIANKPAYSFLGKRDEIRKTLNETEQEIWDLLKIVKNMKIEERQEQAEELKKEVRELLEKFIPYFVLNTSLKEIEKFYSIIEKQYDVLTGEKSRVELEYQNDEVW